MSEGQIRINDNKGTFYIEVEGKQEAMMTFVLLAKIKSSSTTLKLLLEMKGKVLVKKW